MSVEKRAQVIQAAVRVVNDEESLQKVCTIRLMAWRRIGQILLEGCPRKAGEAYAHYAARVRNSGTESEAAQALSNAQIIEAIKISSIPEDEFERHSASARSRTALINAAHPETVERRALRAEGEAAIRAETERYLKETEALRLEEEGDRRLAERVSSSLLDEHITALREVGYTLREAPNDLQRVMVILTMDEYSMLRRAQMEHKNKNISRMEIMRQGLRMWLIANGYELKPTS
jgi:hypothetical protein